MDDVMEKLASSSEQDQLEALIQVTNEQRLGLMEAVLPLLDSPDEGVREYSAKYLGLCAPIGNERAGARVLALCGDSNEFVRGAAAVALGLMRYAPALPALERMARYDPDELVRTDAIEGIESLGLDEAFETLEEALRHDRSWLVRRYAAEAIQAVANETRLPVIQELARLPELEAVELIHLWITAHTFGDDASLMEIAALLRREPDVEGAQRHLWSLKWALSSRAAARLRAAADTLRAALNDLAARMPVLQPLCDEVEWLLPPEK